MEKTEPVVTIDGEALRVVFRLYAGGRTAIELRDDLGCPYSKCTVNVPEVDLEDNEVIIKNYAENAGQLELLQEAGIIGPVKRDVAVSQHVNAQVCDLLVDTSDEGLG